MNELLQLFDKFLQKAFKYLAFKYLVQQEFV